jgi:hypothetical protein
MLTQEHKDHRMQVSQDLPNHCEAEGDSFLDRIITGDETWCHHYEPEQNDSPWSGDTRIPHQRKTSRCSHQRVKRCALSFGIGKA